MNFLLLEYFLEVVKNKSVTRAAEKLYISQPALSKQIKRLEDDLDCQLFDRTTKQFELNDYGKIVYNYSTQILKLEEQMRSELDLLENKESRIIKITILSASKLFSDVMRSFSAVNPQTSFSIIQDITLKENTPLKIFSKGKLVKENKNLILLFEEDIKLAVPLKHPLAQKDWVSLDDLENQEFIELTRGNDLRNITDTFFSNHNFEPLVTLECDNPQLLREFIGLELGLSFVPEKTWPINIDNIKLLNIFPHGIKRYIYLEIDDITKLRLIERQFVDFISKYFADY